MRRRLGDQGGQAAVELVAVLPAVLVCTAIVWQIVLGGATLWAAAHAARTAGRAAVVGRDATQAARRALPDALEPGLRVTRLDRAVRVRVRVPLLVPGRPSPISVTAAAGLGAPP